MKLEDQVVSLELARKLKDLKVPQISHFYHIAGCIMPFPDTTIQECSAFTASELGEMLPPHVKTYKYPAGDWCCYSFTVSKRKGDTEADARAKMLIYLLENKLITL